MKCKICEGSTREYATTTVRGVFQTGIWRCLHCGYVFLHPVNWLEEAYQQPINPTDIGYVQRNLDAAGFLTTLLNVPKSEHNLYCDYGAGYGLLVRLMRDQGFRFHWHDPHCQNLFATFCDASIENFAPYSAVTAIEVFEHVLDPVALLQEITEFGKCVIVTTELLPAAEPAPGAWWYFGLDHGQHISFYSTKALECLGNRFNLKYTKLRNGWHIFEPLLGNQQINSLWHANIRKAERRTFATRTATRLKKISWKLGIVFEESMRRFETPNRESLTQADFEAVINIVRKNKQPADARFNIDDVLGFGKHSQNSIRN